MATTRLYKVATPTGDRLIETTNPTRAIAHVAKSQYTVTIPASHEVYGRLTTDDDFFTHWAPMPKFKD